MSSRHHPIREWLNLQLVKNPARMILCGIILLNVVFFFAAALVISALSPSSLDYSGFWPSVFYTVTMVLDAGCISYVVEDVGTSGVAVIIACIIIVLIGMVTFTGCVVGYITNFISDFVSNSNADNRKLNVSGHTVILNWNNRASEIINDLLFSEHPETIVVLVNSNRDAVRKEIDNRLADTIARENIPVQKKARELGPISGQLYYRSHHFRSRLTVLVKEGDTFSGKQLMDISLDRAKAVIILNQSPDNVTCRYNQEDFYETRMKGNAVTLKTLVLVAEITSAETSADDQKIIVEVEDPGTDDLVQQIIHHKEKLAKCNIIPVSVNKVLGQLLSQFSIMPQLNQVYEELFSNKGAEFYAIDTHNEPVRSISDYMSTHFHTIPLTAMDTKTGRHCFFMADKEKDLETTSTMPESTYTVKGNPDCWQPRRNVLILGHNSKIRALMDGFQSYRDEWNPAKDGRDILNICVVDDKIGLERIDYFREYKDYVSRVVAADLFDRQTIEREINSFIDDQDGDTCILVLSDDAVSNEDLDAGALTYLIYIQDILAHRKELHGGHDVERIDVVVEILNPKNVDVVHSYSVDNVVISNRYISKMITQIGDKEALFEFYKDILSYDEAGADAYTSMELYIKKVSDVFAEIPGPCTAAELIRAIYRDNKQFDERNTTIALGWLEADDTMHLFSGDQREIPVELTANDKLIVFSNH